MKKLINERVEEGCNFYKSELIIIGVSGGADSICLLDCMHKQDYKLVVAHFNHLLRPSAFKDALFVENLSTDLGLQFELGSGDVEKFAKESNRSIEEAARILRYQFLFNTAKKFHSKTIVVAHNADDQVETVLMHLIRGSGISGLTGMKQKTTIDEFDKEIFILRPFLSVWRSEIESYIFSNGLSFCEDETNQDIKYTRNKIRNTVIPEIEKSYPKFKEQIWQSSSLLSEDKTIIDKQVNQTWEEIIDYTKNGVICCNRSDFLLLNLGIQRHLLRKIVTFLKPTIRDISFESIQRGIDNLSRNKPGIIDLEGNLCLEINHSTFFVYHKNTNWVELFFPQIQDEHSISVLEDRLVQLSPTWFLKFQFLENSIDQLQIEKSNPNLIEIDYDSLIHAQLKVTNKSAGDRFSPFGMNKKMQKIGELFINEKIPKSARKNWPILKEMDGKIIWVIGLRLSDDYKITFKTKKILRLEILQKL